MITAQIFLITVGILVAAAAGNLGTYMVLKRMSLVGDALSHVALPGIAIAIALGISPMLGAFVALTIGILLVWYLGEKSSIYPEALVGIIFTTSLALGVLLTPEPDLLEALFGNLQKISTGEGLIAIALSLAVILITRLISKPLLLNIVSEDLARSIGIKSGLVNLLYLLSIGVVVALGVRFVGTLLTGALVIVPAAAARNISRKLTTYTLLSTLFGILSALIGVALSQIINISSGPLVVLTSVLLFTITYLLKYLSPQKQVV